MPRWSAPARVAHMCRCELRPLQDEQPPVCAGRSGLPTALRAHPMRPARGAAAVQGAQTRPSHGSAAPRARSRNLELPARRRPKRPFSRTTRAHDDAGPWRAAAQGATRGQATVPPRRGALRGSVKLLARRRTERSLNGAVRANDAACPRCCGQRRPLRAAKRRPR